MSMPPPEHAEERSPQQGSQFQQPQQFQQSSPQYPQQMQPYQHFGQGPPQQMVYVQAAGAGNSSLAPVTALICGLLALMIAWIPFLGLGAWILAPVGLTFGILGLRRGKAEHKIMSWIGIVASGIALMICFGWVLLLFAGLGA